MTFTRAATRELSDRIRARLAAGGALLSRRMRCAAARPCWRRCCRLPRRPRACRPPGGWRWRPRHGRRGRAHHRRLVPAHAARARLRQRLPVRRRTGRRRTQPARRGRAGLLAPAGAIRWTARSWTCWPCGRSVDALADARAADQPNCRPRPAGQPGRLHRAGLPSAAAADLAALKQGWAARAGRCRPGWTAQRPGKDCGLDKRKLRSATTRPGCRRAGRLGEQARCRRPGTDDRPQPPHAPRACWTRAKPGAPPLSCPRCLCRLAQLLAGAAACPHWRVRCACTRPPAWPAAPGRAQAQAGSFGFADMLQRLDRGLGPAPCMAPAPARQRILAQYPVALIDEFQDTSPLQYRIFDRSTAVRTTTRPPRCC
jgi:exodeoxyribonuclease V beta subunit